MPKATILNRQAKFRYGLHAFMRQGRRRNVLISALAIFMCCQLAFSLALENKWLHLRDPEYARKLASLRAKMEKNTASRPLVVMVGSSQTGVNICPSQFAACPDLAQQPVIGNFGLCSADPVLENLCFRRLLSDGIRPDWLLVEVSPLFFNRSAPGARPMADYSIDANRLDWKDWRFLIHYHSEPRRLTREWLIDRLVPIYAQRFLVQSEYAHAWLPPSLQRFDFGWRFLDDWGWSDMPDYQVLGTMSQWQARVSFQRDRLRPFFAHFSPHETSNRALGDLIALAERERICVALLLMPDYFRSWYSPECRSEMDAYLAHWSHQPGVRFVDMRDWAPDTGFWDGVHFVRSMTDEFSRAFSKAVLAPLLQGRPISSDDRQVRLLKPVRLEWRGGFSPCETKDSASWRWCSHQGELYLENPTRSPRVVHLDMTCRPATTEPGQLRINGPVLSLAQCASAVAPVRVDQDVTIPPGCHLVSFSCDTKPLKTPNDPRTLVFTVENFAYREVK